MYKLFLLLLASLLFIQCDSEDPCKTEVNPACVCTADYAPVCGCDDVTYTNACAAKCAGVKTFKEGTCNINESIVGEWDFLGYNSQDGVLTSLKKSHNYDVFINFTNEKVNTNFLSFTGRSGVNILNGRYQIVNGNQLNFENLTQTEIGSEPIAAAFESQYMKWMQADKTYSILNTNVLIITCSRSGLSEKLIYIRK